MTPSQIRGRRELTRDGRRGRDSRRHEMGAATWTLPALEVAVGRRCAALTGRELVRVHAETHGASGTAPVGACGAEDLVQTFGFGLRADSDRARNDENP